MLLYTQTFNKSEPVDMSEKKKKRKKIMYMHEKQSTERSWGIERLQGSQFNKCYAKLNN